MWHENCKHSMWASVRLKFASMFMVWVKTDSKLGELKNTRLTQEVFSKILKCRQWKKNVFGSVVCKPIISGHDSNLVLVIIAPMELHLLISVVNHLFKTLKGIWSQADNWPAQLNIQQSPYHGRQFEGISAESFSTILIHFSFLMKTVKFAWSLES